MSYIPTVEQARELVARYNKDSFHLQHAETVSKVMGELAKEFDPERVDFWAAVGMLHDIDFELYPEQHCVKANEMLHELDIDEEMIHAVISHGYGICIDVKPEKYMEKVLFAIDELSGLIGAVAIMRPSKSVQDLELKSVKKKYKDKGFEILDFPCNQFGHQAPGEDDEIHELISEEGCCNHNPVTKNK